MARLKNLPSLGVIFGLRGKVDFYVWRGIPCARRWPVTPRAHRTAASDTSAAEFGRISAAYHLLPPLALEAYEETAKGTPRTRRDVYISATYGHLHAMVEPAPPPPPEEEMYNAYVCLRDVKAIGQEGGDFIAGDWRTRDLTEEQADTANICTLAANQFTLPAGSYRCQIAAPAYWVGGHQARLYDITGAAALLLGANARTSRDVNMMTHALVVGRFTLGVESTLEVQHRCEFTSGPRGFGLRNIFDNEIYTLAEFWRETPP